DPVGRGDHRFVARVDHGEDQIEDGLLRAARYQHLFACVVEPVLALELRDDGVLELRGAFDGRVARVTLADRFDTRIRNVRRRVEIRLAGAETDDVLAFRFELRHAPRERDSGGGL